jgi:hypothetical protein
MLFSICFVLVQFIHMMTVNSVASTANYNVKVFDSANTLRGYLIAHDPDGWAELTIQSGLASSVQIQTTQDNKMTVGI